MVLEKKKIPLKSGEIFRMTERKMYYKLPKNLKKVANEKNVDKNLNIFFLTVGALIQLKNSQMKAEPLHVICIFIMYF